MIDHDVVIVGGGINGVGIAQAAAAAGHDVLVLEQRELASGTSHRSSKLIHGGLRYLESAQFSLVRESLHERRMLLKLAPGLVQLKPFHIPIYPHTRRRPWLLFLGLSLYAVLAGLRPSARFDRVPRRDWERLDGLSTHGLEAVFRYRDAQTDDAALVRAVMRSAAGLGARLAAPARFLHAVRRDPGCLVDYEQDGRTHRIGCRVLVNAAGPWAAAVAGRIEPAVPQPNVELVQGSHILIPGHLSRGVYYVENPRDGRAIFVMPAPHGILVGTTEKAYRGDPARARASHPEQHYLFSVLKHYFPRFRELDYADIIRTTAGLRVLPLSPRHAFHRSREVLLSVDHPRDPRVVSVYGGKLTTFRATAQKVLRCLAPSLPRRDPVANVDHLPLTPEAT